MTRPSQQLEERAVFAKFADACAREGLARFDLEALIQRDPPRPDLEVCRSDVDETVAFELTRIQDEGSARRLARSLDAESALRDALRQRGLTDRDVWLAFRTDTPVSSASIRRAIPTILDAVEQVEPSDKLDLGAAIELPKALRRVVQTMVVHRGLGGSVHASSYGHPGDPVVSRITDKFGNTYESEAPVELLCYYMLQDSGTYEILERFRDEARSYVTRNIARSPFRRVWIYDADHGRVLDVLPS